MIFLTVGTQLPFERLVRAVDMWASRHPDIEVFAQIGDTKYEPKNMKWVRLLDPKCYNDLLSQAAVVVGHVGMGTIITGVEYGVPLVLMPRQVALGEHRNDHQIASAKQFAKLSGVSIVNNSEQLELEMDRVFSLPKCGDETDARKLSVSQTLIERIERFVAQSS